MGGRTVCTVWLGGPMRISWGMIAVLTASCAVQPDWTTRSLADCEPFVLGEDPRAAGPPVVDWDLVYYQTLVPAEIRAMPARGGGVAAGVAELGGHGAAPMFIEDDALYWMVDSGSSGDRALRRVSRAGGEARSVLQRRFLYVIGFDQEWVYYHYEDGISRTPRIELGQPEAIHEPLGELGRRAVYALGADRLYVVTDGVIETLPKSGGQRQSLVRIDDAVEVTEHGEFLYVARASGVLSRMFTSGGGLHDLAILPEGERMTAPPVIDHGWVFVQTENAVDGRSFWAVPLEGGDATRLVGPEWLVSAFAVTPHYVYWVDRGDPERAIGTILRLPRACSAPPVWEPAAPEVRAE